MSNTLPKVIGSCFGCLGVLIVCAIILISLFYIEEDRRGAHELAEAKARWQAAGYSLSPADYIPPPVPDSQNLAALSVYKLDPDPHNHERLLDRHLRDAFDEDKHGGELFSVNNRNLAELVAKAYAKQFPNKTAPKSSRTQLEELYPVIADLREAAKTRSLLRLNLNYQYQPAWNRSFGPVTTQIRVVKFLSYDANLALRENQPQVALDDVALGFQVARGAAKDPSLIGGLVMLGDCAIIRTTIDDGLIGHSWSEPQLVMIQNEFKREDYLSVFPFDMRSEVVMLSLPIYEMLEINPSKMNSVQAGASEWEKDASNWPLSVWSIWPTGWWDMNAAKTVDVMREATECDDIPARLVDPVRIQQLESKAEKAKDSPRPWNILYSISAGPVMHSLEKFAQGQAQLDEDRIVCGLERYRLAHNAYPASLDALTPQFADALPHDIMSGEPYHYRLKPDGTFLLYSVGWDQIDEGGTVGYQADDPNKINYELGDWVWPMVKR